MTGYTPIYNLPYVEASDLVANYPAVSEELAENVETAIGGASKILQVLSTGKTDTFTTTSTSFTDITGLSVTITPSAAGNKVMVLAMISGSNDAGVSLFHLRLMRDSTPIGVGDSAGSRFQGSTSLSPADTDVNMGMSTNIMWLDAPNTTSAVTYKIQGVVSGGTGFINRSDADANSSLSSRNVSTITVMEIAA